MRKNTSTATKADVERTVGELAKMTARGFSDTEKQLGGRIVALNEKVDTGFTELRQEMQDGFRMVLAAIETVEYTKLRMRIDSLETDVAKIKQKVRM